MYRPGGNVVPPQVLHNVNPRYPETAKGLGVQGLVMLEAVIDSHGVVGDVTVKNGHPALSQAAIRAARQWKFEPATLDGEPVSVYFALAVNFTLR